MDIDLAKYADDTTPYACDLERLNPKLKIGKQINALADYAKPTPSELDLFDWPLLRQINVC